MEIFVYTGDNRDLAGIVSIYSNFRTVWRYDEPGEFTLRIPINGLKGLPPLTPGTWLWPQGARELFIVESMVLSDHDGREEAELTGRTASALLERRVAPDSAIGTGTHTQLISGLLESIFDNPDRTFPGLSLQIDTDLGESVTYQAQVGPVLDSITELCQASGLGYETVFDPVEKGLTFRVYQANDLTAVGEGVTVVFDPEFDNISDYQFTDDIREYRNVSYVTGGVNSNGQAYHQVVSAPKYDADGNQVEDEFTGYARFETVTKYAKGNQAGGTGGSDGNSGTVHPEGQYLGAFYSPCNQWKFGNVGG
ncbi:hypothetical protein FACS1894184_11680 [Clostridia bacterium]|nr:hypothetical protein FACS1894184_11680 [Clostridia bacterium]